MGNYNFYDGKGHLVNWLGGTTGTIFARERELIPVPVKSCGDIPAGIFPKTALVINLKYINVKR